MDKRRFTNWWIHCYCSQDKAPEVYTPFNTEATQISMEKDVCTLTLPEKCAYAIFHFPK